MKMDGVDIMEIMNLNLNENIIDSYAVKPNLFYNVEGLLVEKAGKNIKIEKNIEHIKVTYSLRLIDGIDAKVGEKVLIPKDNIAYMRIEKNREDTNINVKEAIKKLGLEDTEEVENAIVNLMDNGIPISKENIESFLATKGYLANIVENLDFDTCIKLMERNIDIEKASLQQLVEALEGIKIEEKNLLRELFNFNRSLSFKEAERLAEEIYHRKMGKDVYDAIIALHKHNIPINKDNIERILEAINKLYDLKDCNDEVFVKTVIDKAPVNIETLHKFKYSYKKGKLEENIAGTLYEQFTVIKEPSLEDILAILKKLNIINSQENIQLAREFLIAGVKIDKTTFDKISTMKQNLKELISLSNEENMARLMEEGLDPLKEDIGVLVNRLKIMEKEGRPVLVEADNILGHLEALDKITDRELLELIRRGEDFKLENLKKLVETGIRPNSNFEKEVIEKTITISNIFNTLGNLNSDTIALAVRKYEHISLSNLYISHMELVNRKEVNVSPISESQEGLIRQEYLNIKNNTTINLINESIKERISIEHMPLEQLNEYIDKKVLKYRETQKLLNEISLLRGRENSVIPLVMKNGLDMSLKELNYINSIFNRGWGIGNLFNNLVIEKDSYEEGLKKGISILENKIKEFTKALKEGKNNIQKEYKEVFKAFEELANSFDFQEERENSHMKAMKDYIELQKSLSKDLILQLPISLSNEYGNINLLIPNISKGVDKSHMDLYLSLNTGKLGQVKFNLKVRNKKVYVAFKGDRQEKILNNKDILKKGLDKLGYSLEKIEIID